MGNVSFCESLCVAEYESVGFYWGRGKEGELLKMACPSSPYPVSGKIARCDFCSLNIV